MIKNFIKEFARTGAIVLVGLFAVAGIAIAQSTFTAPTTAAPGGNVAAPVNVGSGFQDKAGDLWARAVGSTNGFTVGTGANSSSWYVDTADSNLATLKAGKYCIGSDCVKEWKAGTCRMNTYVKESTGTGHTPYNPGNGAGTTLVGAGCSLTTTEQAAGWFLMSWDQCSGVASRDCRGPSYCHYGQMQCDGRVEIVAGTFANGNGPLVPPSQAQLQSQCTAASGTWTAGTNGGSGYCTYPQPPAWEPDPDAGSTYTTSGTRPNIQ